MGAGASSVEVDNHMKRWEHAISDLSALCAHNRREMGGDIQSPEVQSQKGDGKGDENEVDRSLRRRASSLVSFNSKRAGPQSPGGHVDQPSQKTGGLEFLAGDEATLPVEKKVVEKKVNRQAIQEIHRTRLVLYKSYVDQPLHEVVGKLACDHFATVAVALSTLLGGQSNAKDRRERVTVEDVFFAAHVPLHLLHTESMHLTELYDVVREFIDVDNRFKGNYQVEVVHFDVAPTVGQVESGTNEVGDRQTKVQLPEFRKQVLGFLDEDPNTAIVVNYDPFVLEQDTLMEDDDDDEMENSSSGVVGNTLGAMGGDTLMASVMHSNNKKGPRFTQKNTGAYASIADCRNAVQFMVSLARGAATDRLHCEIEEVPINSLFKSMARHSEGQRAKGYLRITKKANKVEEAKDTDSTAEPESLPTFFSPELCSGTVVGSLSQGTHANTIHTTLSPHLVAVAWALHFIKGANENTHHHGSGLPVGDIINSTQLPSDIYLNCDLPIDAVYRYAKAYLTAQKLDSKLSLEVQQVKTRISRDDAVPNISVFELESFLLNNKAVNTNPEAPNSVMMIQYNADVAHNVLGIATTSQWCILVGYDRDMQTATLIDASAKKFCATWTCSLERLHKAITKYGFMVLSRVEVAQAVRTKLDSARSSSNGKKPEAEFAPVDCVDAFKTFPLPTTPFAVTVLAMCFSRMGIDTNFDDILATLPFQISAVLNSRLGIESVLILVRYFLERRSLNSKFTVKPIHFDKIDGVQVVSAADLRETITEAMALGNKRTVVAHFHPHFLTVNDSSNPFGAYGLVTGFDATTDIVSVTDCNPNRFYRTWNVTIEALHESISILRHQGGRSRGLLIFDKLDTEVDTKPLGASRTFSLESVPLQNAFQTSPSAQVQGLSIAFAQLGHYYSPEELFYEAYLKTVNDQRRRGSQAYAWRDVEVSLAILNKKIDCRLMTLVARKFIESRKVANLTVEQLDEVDQSDLPEILAECCDDEADHLILLNYDAKRVHKLSDMGSSVAIVKSYNPDNDMVELMDCEYCLYGLNWSCDLKTLSYAADLENPGTSKYGFIKIVRKNIEKRAGIGLAKSPNVAPLEGGEKREKLTKFVGGDEGEL